MTRRMKYPECAVNRFRSLSFYPEADKYVPSDKTVEIRRPRNDVRTNRIALHLDVARASNGCPRTLRNGIRVRRGGGAGGPNKTAIRRYVTFTDVVVVADIRKRGGSPRIQRVVLRPSRFLRSLLSRG